MLPSLGNVPDPWYASRALLGLQYGNRAIQLCVDEEILEPCLQDSTQAQRVRLAEKVTRRRQGNGLSHRYVPGEAP